MSTSDGSFQTQIASVLDALVKVAAEELTKLFDSHYLAFRSTLLVDGRTEQSATPGFFKTPPSKTFQSVAVQVDGRAVYFEPSTKDRCCPIEGSNDCLKEGREKVDTPLVETNEPKDLGDTSLKEKDEKGMSCSSRYPETTNKELHTQGPAKDTCSAVPSTSITRKLRSLQTKSKNRIDARNKTNNSRPTVVKEEKQAPAPQPETMEEPAPVELQQDSVSTAKGTAYSPVSSDGVIAPLTVSLWDRLASVKDVVNEHKKETSRDQKLLLPCSVQLVNLSLVEVQGKTGRTGGGGGGSGGSGSSSPETRKGFQTPKDLRTHQSIHTGRRLCCFTKCGNGVWRLQRVISQSNSHCCKICGKKFKRRKILRRHERFHTGEKPYRCPKCHKRFALRKSLRRHQRFHSGEKPHTCPQCGKSFRLRDNLKAHLRFHTGERPFTCSICTKSFRIYRNLTEHQRSHL